MANASAMVSAYKKSGLQLLEWAQTLFLLDHLWALLVV